MFSHHKFYVNPEPLKQIAQVPIMPSGFASLPHPVFFIGTPASAPSASSPEIAADAAGGVLEQAEDVRMEEDRKRKQEEAKLTTNPLDDPDGHQDVVEKIG